MKQREQLALMAQTVAALLEANSKGRKIPHDVANGTGWYIYFAAGRTPEWAAMARRIVDHVVGKVDDPSPPELGSNGSTSSP